MQLFIVKRTIIFVLIPNFENRWIRFREFDFYEKTKWNFFNRNFLSSTKVDESIGILILCLFSFFPMIISRLVSHRHRENSFTTGFTQIIKTECRLINIFLLGSPEIIIIRTWISLLTVAVANSVAHEHVPATGGHVSALSDKVQPDVMSSGHLCMRKLSELKIHRNNIACISWMND